MKTYRVFLGLGSNVGSREKFLNNAVAALKRLRDTKVIWASPVYETDPVGKTDQPKFLNAAVEIETCVAPKELFQEVKAMEKALGRTDGERWGPREIDIDILVYDGVVFQDEELTVPHARMEERRFVLVPLHDLDPDLVHPVNGMTVAELLSACRDAGRVVQSYHKIIL
jgi:2-amino-4-hydroxy-6-hydroxymethyldihydropteridine diphosphokinase